MEKLRLEYKGCKMHAGLRLRKKRCLMKAAICQMEVDAGT
jgi:hypothetical protein